MIVYLIIGIVTLQVIAGITLAPGEVRIVILDPDELTGLGCLTLAVLDQRGNTWPIRGFGLEK